MKKIAIYALCLIIAFTGLLGCAKIPPDFSEPPNNELPGEPEIPPIPPAPDVPNVPEVPPVPDVPGVPEIPPVPDVPVPPVPEPPPVSKSTMIMATSQGVTVRAGAGTNYKAVGSMDFGDRLKYILTKNGWYEVFYKGAKGYVSASYCVIVTFDLSSSKIEKVIGVGEKYLGTPYVFGAQRYHWGNGVLNSSFTTKAFDCSSLMQYMLKVGANVNVATTSREQSLQGAAVKRQNLQRGDVMFFTNSSRLDNVGIERIGHVGMYLGDNYILHTSSDFAVIEPINNTRWGYLINIRRFV